MPYAKPEDRRAAQRRRCKADPRVKENMLRWRIENPAAWEAIQEKSYPKTKERSRVRSAERRSGSTAEERKAACDRARAWRLENIGRYILSRLRRRTQELGVPFDLEATDIVVPYVCPVLGIPIVVDGNGQRDNSPSVDRKIPGLGYVKGNVRVISMRANRIKNDATVEELALVLADARRLHGKGK